jgi:hypothetical protein
VKPLINVFEIFAQLVMVRIVRRPGPVVVDLWYGERVNWVLAVDPRPRISVPVPNTS